MSNTTHQPPPRPWNKGNHADYSALVLEVEVCRDTQGQVFSSHRLQDGEDRRVALSWPSGGLEQAGFALLLEALRREALLAVLASMSRDPEILTRGPTEKLIQDWGQAVQELVTRSTKQLVEGAVRDAVRSLSLVP